MKNLKKLFAVIVVVAMLASFAVPAFAAAPADVQGTQYEDAVSRLVALGIITGRPDGTFAPNDTITRAEFAAVVVRSYGYDTAAAAAKGQTKFADVSADFWASGYINLASSLGIINGRPDGNFGPNDPVRYEEAITMIVRALGYEPKAKALGGYPGGYLAISSQEEIDKDAAGTAGMFAPRGMVAILMNNALEVPMMEQTGFGDEVKYEVPANAKTLLDAYLKLEKYTGEVTAVESDEITISGRDSDDTADATYNFDVVDGLSTNGLIDTYVTMWEKDDVVYAIEVKSNTYFGHVQSVEGETHPLEIAALAANSVDPANAAGEYEMTVAGQKLKVEDDTIVDGVAANINQLADDRYYVKAIVKDGDVKKVVFFDLTKGGIIAGIDGDEIEYLQSGDDVVVNDDAEDAETVTVVVDGKVATFADLEADMMFDYDMDANDNLLIVASSAQVAGELTAVGTPSKILVDGKPIFSEAATATAYVSTDAGEEFAGFANTAIMAELDDLVGEEVVVYVNSAGAYRYIKSATDVVNATFFGQLNAVDLGGFSEQIKVIREMDGAFEKATYTLDLDTGYTSGTAATAASIASDDIGKVFQFSLSEEGKITKFELDVDEAAGSDQVDNAVVTAFNEDTDTIENAAQNLKVTTATTIVEAYTSGTSTKYREVEWANLEGKALGGSTPNFYAIEKKGIAQFVIFGASELDAVTGTDQFIAYTSGAGKIGTTEYQATIAKADGSTEVITSTDALSNDKFVVYTQAGNGQIDVITNGVLAWSDSATGNFSGALTVTGSTYSVDSDVLVHAGGTEYVSDSVMVYQVSGSGDTVYKKSSVSSITEGDRVLFYLDATKNEVTAIMFQKD